MINPYKNLPIDKNMNPMQDFPTPFLAKFRTTSENATVSSIINLTPDTTTLEVSAIGGPAVLRWVGTGDTQGSVITIAGATANYDNVIPTATVRRFAVPIEGIYAAPSSLVGVNIENGLYRRVAIKSIGIASVMMSEF